MPVSRSTAGGVSVIIATHNRAQQVVEAIDSVLHQTLPPLEVIVVDDGSTDNTRETLARYGSSIRLFSIPSSGASEARNRGMRAATGEWIAFLDDDDVWVPEKLERQMEVAGRNPAAALIYSSDYAVDPSLRILYRRSADPGNRGDVFERLVAGNFIFTSCVIARRDSVEKAAYMDPALRFAQDWDLWLKIAAIHPVDFSPEPLVLYRQQPQCLTRDMRTNDKLREMQTVLERALKTRPPAAEVSRRARKAISVQWAAACLQDGRRWKAFRHSLQAAAPRLILRTALPEGLCRTLRNFMPAAAPAGAASPGPEAR